VEWAPITLDDVRAAAERIRPHLRPTPLYRYAGLERLTGAQVWVKHENHQPVGAFKVRGGVNLVAQLSDDERERGLIAASTGNHGQSVAYAARLYGITARICAPEGVNPVKLDAMESLGAEVLVGGRDFDEARERSERLAAEHGYRYVHSGDEPQLIAGVGTETLEIVDELPHVETIVVPIGGGSGAAGACVVAKAVDPPVEVIGVQSEAAPAAFNAWRTGTMAAGENATTAEGLATRVPFALPQSILREHLDDFLLVSEEELAEATRLMIEHTRNLVEPAGAAPLAAALRVGDRLRGRRIALIASGGNISPAQLASLYND
jgi:threonine dehydratase